MANFWSLLGVLAAVVLILYLAYAATKWIGTHSAPGGSGPLHVGTNANFRILGQLGVGRNERLVLARLDERCYLLGVTEHQITLLRELDGDEAAAWLAQGEQPSAPGFAEILSKNLRKKK
ncbi:MAG: flagellar biosynthetic protein FliO [Oscillospiraceae bacterium]|nr:flagellar biosynthetic protein FliO [Oscillospiraceae bacterium]